MAVYEKSRRTANSKAYQEFDFPPTLARAITNFTLNSREPSRQVYAPTLLPQHRSMVASTTSARTAMIKPQKIAIIGAGTAGLASALVLRRQGHDISIFEKAAQIEHVGAGLLVQPSGLAVFQHLGVLEHAMDLGAPIDALKGWSKKRLLVKSHYQEASADFIGLGMHRASLCEVLIAQLRADGIQWHFGCDVHRLHDHISHMQLTSVDKQGASASYDFDFVLVANGARSHLRPAAWTRLDKPYPWGAVWAIVPEATDLDYRVLHQFYHGASRMMGLLPTGRTPDGKGTRLTSVFWSLPAQKIDAWITSPQTFSSWSDEVRQLWPSAATWIQQSLPTDTPFLPARYRDVVLRKYGENRMGIVGDAAHAMSPQLGQGANMALLDAWALGRAFEHAQSFPEIWQHYHRLRQPSIQFYQTMSRLLTPFYQSNSASLGLARDMGFTWMAKLAWMRKQMARTIAGIKRGALVEIDLDAIRRLP